MNNYLITYEWNYDEEGYPVLGMNTAKEAVDYFKEIMPSYLPPLIVRVELMAEIPKDLWS